jgi:hypothetical protein
LGSGALCQHHKQAEARENHHCRPRLQQGPGLKAADPESAAQSRRDANKAE